MFLEVALALTLQDIGWLFVNPGHADRLKKVIYRRRADGNLTARVEGENHGAAFSEDYAYHRLAGAPRCGAK